MLAHPARLAPGVSDYQCVIRNIARNHRPRANKREAAYRVPADNRGIGPNSCSLLHQRLLVLVTPVHRAAGIGNIRKDHGRAEKNIVFTNHPGIDGHVILHFYIIAQDDLRRDHHVLTNVATRSDATTRHEVREVPDPGTFPDFTTGVDDGGLVCGVGGHVNQIVR